MSNSTDRVRTEVKELLQPHFGVFDADALTDLVMDRVGPLIVERNEARDELRSQDERDRTVDELRKLARKYRSERDEQRQRAELAEASADARAKTLAGREYAIAERDATIARVREVARRWREAPGSIPWFDAGVELDAALDGTGGETS